MSAKKKGLYAFSARTAHAQLYLRLNRGLCEANAPNAASQRLCLSTKDETNTRAWNQQARVCRDEDGNNRFRRAPRVEATHVLRMREQYQGGSSATALPRTWATKTKRDQTAAREGANRRNKPIKLITGAPCWSFEAGNYRISDHTVPLVRHVIEHPPPRTLSSYLPLVFRA